MQFGNEFLKRLKRVLDGTSWDLRNELGRIVVNGSYLVIVEAKDKNENVYYYSAKVGVKR